MQWLEAALETTSTEIEPLCDRLTALGIDGISIEDEQDFQNFLQQNRKFWEEVDPALSDHFRGRSRVKFYLPADEEGRRQLAYVAAELNEQPRVAVVDDADWENQWRQYYEPIPVGKQILIIPDWIQTEAEERIPLRLEPGLTFGTGNHATTRLCLAALETLELPGKRVLDLGCGSGILGIAALLLGADTVTGCDVDPKSADAAAENGRLNGFDAKRLHLETGDILTDAGLRRRIGRDYDVVMANIVADVIIPLARYLPDFLAKNGVFLCSGILDSRSEDVLQSYADAGYQLTAHTREEDWNCFLMQAGNQVPLS